MNPEEKKMLQEVLELSRENNKYLKRLWRSEALSSVMRVLYWIVIIGAAVGAFYFIQPYLNAIQSATGAISSSSGNVLDILNNLSSVGIPPVK